VNVYGAAVTADCGAFGSNSGVGWLLVCRDVGRSGRNDFRDFERDLSDEAHTAWWGTSQSECRRYRRVRRMLQSKSCGDSRRRQMGLPVQLVLQLWKSGIRQIDDKGCRFVG
jgi:hypothetical protein